MSVWQVVCESFISYERTSFASSTEEPHAKITRMKKWVKYADWRSSWTTVWGTAGGGRGALDVVGDWITCVGFR